MSIAKNGYPNRRSFFLQSLTPLDVEYYVARLFNIVNLIPISIAKDGYPNRNLVFYNLLTPLGVEYLCSQANRNTAVQTQFQQKR